MSLAEERDCCLVQKSINGMGNGIGASIRKWQWQKNKTIGDGIDGGK